MTEYTAPNLMLQSTMPGINTNNIQSKTSEMNQITLKFIPVEALITEVKGATAVSDDDLTANVFQSLMIKESVREAPNPEAEPEAKIVILYCDDDNEETKHHQ